jgi:hypothetical protein
MDNVEPENITSNPNQFTDLSTQSTSIPSKPKRNYDKKVHGKRYNLATKIAIAAMQGTGLSATQAAAATGAHISTISRAWDNPELAELTPQVVQKTKSGLGGLFYKRALGSLLELTHEKLRESSALQLATTAGIMVDKARLMEGLSTENVSFRGVTEAIESDREKLMKRIEELG